MSANPGIKLGYVSGVYGIKGWIKVYSHTSPLDNILRFPSWQLGTGARTERFSVEDGKWHGKTTIAKLAGINTRDEALELVGYGIFVERAELPQLPENEYYWADLVGLDVFTDRGVSLGLIEKLLETGANDVLVVRGERERLIPFIQKEIVQLVDLKQRRVVVSWDPDF